MPMGMEIMLGVVGPDAATKTLMSMFPQLKEEEIDFENSEFIHEGLAELCHLLNRQLGHAHRQMLGNAGFTHISKAKGEYIQAITPEGKREFAPLCLEIVYDYSEVGQELDELCFGVSLSSRYFPTFPTFLDWKYTHGSLICMSMRGMEPLFKIAREEIGKVIPWIKDADVCIVLRWY